MKLCLLLAPPTDLQAFVLSSVELQVLTGSCFKLRTVHNIPVTSNKDGKIWNSRLPSQQVQATGTLLGVVYKDQGKVWLLMAGLSAQCDWKGSPAGTQGL